MTNPSFPYQGVIVRDSLSDNGSSPTMDCVYRSPDIIPYGDANLTIADATSTYGSDIGKGLSTGGQSVNNVFVRSKNLNSASQTANVKLYYASASLLNAPTIGGVWQSVLTGTGNASVPFVSAGTPPSSTLPSGSISLSEQAFALNGLNPPSPNDHYCLMAIVDEPGFTITVPGSWATNSAFASWVAANPAVGWRNVSQYHDTTNAFAGTYLFGNLNNSEEDFEFIVSCDGPYLPSGTTITITCSDANFPISMSKTVGTPPTSGTQYIAFIPSDPMPKNFAGALTVEIVPSESNPIPSGLKVHFNYYQVPNSSIELDMQMARTVTFVEDTGAEHSNTLVALGAITIVTE